MSQNRWIHNNTGKHASTGTSSGCKCPSWPWPSSVTFRVGSSLFLIINFSQTLTAKAGTRGSFNHRFQNCWCFLPPVTSLRTRVWNWKYITYLNATPFFETRWSWFYVRLLHAVFSFRMFDYVRLFKCSISECLIEFDWQNSGVIKFDYQTQSNNWMIGVRLSLITECSIDYAGNMGKQSSLAICCSHGLQLTVRN